jgi:orotidine-5'-phosphate decarboxylase
VTEGYLDRLAARSATTRTVLCLGLDPDPDGLPPGFSRDLHGIEAFVRLVVEAAVPYVAAVKPNLAYYEAYGSDGMRVLERLRDALPADLPVVIDAKRGDIGTTAARQAEAILGRLRADAVTLNPYLGIDALQPFLDRDGSFIYALCCTSNPSARQLQGQIVAADIRSGWPVEPLYLRVARQAAEWAEPDCIGLVVGATAPTELHEIRALVPRAAFLVPGIGAQGGDIDAVLADGPVAAGPAAGRPGRGLLVNVGRGITAVADHPNGTRDVDHPHEEQADLGDRIRAAARNWASRLPVLS